MVNCSRCLARLNRSRRTHAFATSCPTTLHKRGFDCRAPTRMTGDTLNAWVSPSSELYQGCVWTCRSSYALVTEQLTYASTINSPRAEAVDLWFHQDEAYHHSVWGRYNEFYEITSSHDISSPNLHCGNFCVSLTHDLRMHLIPIALLTGNNSR